MTKPMNPLLRAENRATLIKRGMKSIDNLQNKVIEEANKQIANITEFENTGLFKILCQHPVVPKIVS